MPWFRSLSLVFFIICIISVFVHLSCLLNLNKTMSQLKIGTLNLNGARDVRKRMMLYEYINQKSVDVMFIQETHSDQRNEVDWKREWEGQLFLSHKSSVSGGVAILFSKNMTPVSFESVEIEKGRFLKVIVKFEKIVMVFLNIYAPNSGVERVLFLNLVNTTLKSLNTDDFLVLGGDFNCTENDKVDRNHLEPHVASQRVIKQLVQTFDLCDIWRKMHKTLRQYTWVHCKDNSLSLARLDRFYSFKHQFNIFKSCQINPVGFSDHSAVLCSVLVSCVKSSSAYWHFNTSLLDDKHFKDSFTFFWDVFKQQNIYIALCNSGGIAGKYKSKTFASNTLLMLQKK